MTDSFQRTWKLLPPYHRVVAFSCSNKSALPSPQKIKHRHQWIPSRGNCIAMYTMQVFITLDQIKPPGIISLMVCLSIRRHGAALEIQHWFFKDIQASCEILCCFRWKKKQIFSSRSCWTNGLEAVKCRKLELQPYKDILDFHIQRKDMLHKTWHMAEQCQGYAVKGEKWHTSYLDLHVRTHYRNRPAKSAETVSVSTQEAETVTEGERNSTEHAGIYSHSVCLLLQSGL